MMKATSKIFIFNMSRGYLTVEQVQCRTSQVHEQRIAEHEQDLKMLGASQAALGEDVESLRTAVELLNERLSRFIKWTQERLDFIEEETGIDEKYPGMPETFPVISPAQTHTP